MNMGEQVQAANAQPTLLTRQAQPRVAHALAQSGVPPLLARLLAARGVREASQMDDALAHLLSPATLKGADAAAELLQQAMDAQWRICVVADYDCDGATACAVALRGLAMLGVARERLGYVVPDRSVHGYGLTPAIVDLAMQQPAGRPELLVTVDNGIASLQGIAHAKALGLRVLVTDHHLPALIDGQAALPPADVVVNPNQPGCGFASKALAGVGVIFYVLLALRARLRADGRYASAAQPRLDALLDLVALGTVADVVALDDNNRRLVGQGLKRIRSQRAQPGVAALFAAAGRDPQTASARDFGFAIGPRLNAAGRMADMRLGIACLLTDDAAEAARLAQALDDINRQRRSVEDGMREQADAQVQALLARGDLAAHAGAAPAAVVLFDESFHEGVIGIVAGRLKEKLHRPTFVFARGADGLLKGSGRSIAGFHLRDALDAVAKRAPGVLLRFGGHAMAAGCTVDAAQLARFREELEHIARAWLTADTLARKLLTDGSLPAADISPQTIRLLDTVVWGQGFEAPLFCDAVEVLEQRLVGEKHLKLRVRHEGTVRDAIWFGHTETLPRLARLAYRLSLDNYQGRERVQLVVEAAA